MFLNVSFACKCIFSLDGEGCLCGGSSAVRVAMGCSKCPLLDASLQF